MTQSKSNKPEKLSREERLAKTLRDNLRRRKQAARKTSSTTKTEGSD